MTLQLGNGRFLFAVIDIDCIVLTARGEILVVGTAKTRVNHEILLLVAAISPYLSFEFFFKIFKK